MFFRDIEHFMLYVRTKAQIGYWQEYNPFASGAYFRPLSIYYGVPDGYLVSEHKHDDISQFWVHAYTGYGYLVEPESLVRYKHFLLLFPSLLCHPIGFLGVIACDCLSIVCNLACALYEFSMATKQLCQELLLAVVKKITDLTSSYSAGLTKQLGNALNNSSYRTTHMDIAHAIYHCYPPSEQYRSEAPRKSIKWYEIGAVWHLKLAAKQLLTTMTRPVALVGLTLSNIIGLVAPYQGRHVYASIERNVYFRPVFAPCFQPLSEENPMKAKPVDLRSMKKNKNKIGEINHLFNFDLGNGHKI